MQNAALTPPHATTVLPNTVLRPATVSGGCGAEVELELEGAAVTARLAIADRPLPGDEVLLADGGAGARYVIGILRKLREVEVVTRADDGTTVRLRDDKDGGQVVSIEGADGELVFEYRTAEGRARITAPTGALEIRTDAGDLELSAAKKLRLNAVEGVEIRSGRGVRLDVDDTHFSLTRGGAQLVVEELRARLGRLDAALDGDAKVRADVVDVAADTVKTVARVVRTEADLAVEKLRESYRDVQELAQTRAGRVRMVAKETFRILGERTLLKARRDMKLKGSTIYLD